MKIVRLFVPFLNKLVDIEHIDDVNELSPWSNVLIRYKEEKFEESLDAVFIASINAWNIKVKIDKSITFVRLLNKEEDEKIIKNIEASKDLLKVFTEESKRLKLNLVPIDWLLTFTEKTVLFNYTSKERVDFRDLIKSLALKLKRKIQLRHVWPRDRSSLVWWFWICGREFCCVKFLRNIPTVKAESLKEQDFFHKSTDSLSWACGKLKCCLNYEVYQYKEMKKWMPEYWKRITVKWNKWVVIGLDIFNQRVKVKFEDKTIIFNLSELSKS